MADYRGLEVSDPWEREPARPAARLLLLPSRGLSHFFEPVASEVLDIQTNAAIWYYDPAEGVPDGDEFFDDLRQMQLFVIPVTSHFVYQESRARDVELVFAIENHVPVLPIMQEDIPGRDFSDSCGSLQTLSRHASASDPAATPYEERLRKFLESVLVGDETAKRIRDAFDAYVFLSYRKKDRAHAQRLTRLIRERDFCRDVAIWYDEFLVPGEDFRDPIGRALGRCQAFSLVVTPNLLEPGNYVMREEYPAAVASGKPLVPVEMERTDRGELLELYPGIGRTLSPDGDDELTDALIDALRGVDLRSSDSDPEHNFLVGLAYLTGTDVEVDHGVALELIASAAEAGLDEACRRLVTMYNTGEGVRRDYHKAIDWQRSYVDLLQGRADATHALSDRRALSVALIKLGDKLFGVGDPTGSLFAYERSPSPRSSQPRRHDPIYR